MPATPKYETARWFDPLGRCACGKPATGNLMSYRNDILARCCTRCGEKHVKAAQAALNEKRGVKNG